MSWKRHVSGYAVVGVVATAVHFAVALGVSHFRDWPPLTANACAFVPALLTSYVGNAVVTFESKVRRTDAFARFCVTAIGGFLLNQLIVYVLTVRLGVPFALSLVVVLFTVPPLGFLLAKYWAFKPPR